MIQQTQWCFNHCLETLAGSYKWTAAQVLRLLEQHPAILWITTVLFRKSSWPATGPLEIMNAQPWDTKLPCNLGCLSWTGCYLTHQTIKLGVYSSTPSWKRSGYVCDWVRGGLRTLVSYMKKWPKCLWFPHLLHCLLSPYLVPTASWGGRYDQLTEEEKTWAWFTRGLHNMQAPPESGQLQQYCPFWDIPEG